MMRPVSRQSRDRHGQDHDPDAAIKEGGNHDDERQEGNAEGDIRRAHQDRLDPAAVIAGQQAHHRSDHGDRGRSGKSHQQRRARAMDQLRKDIAPDVGCAQQELLAGLLVGQPDAVFFDDLQGIIGRDDRGEDGDEEEDHEDDQADQRQAIALEDFQIGLPKLHGQAL